MTLPTKTQVALGGAVIVATFALGRFTAGKAEVKTDAKITQNKTIDQAKDTHTHTVTTTTKAKDGTTQITKVTDTDITDKKDTLISTQERVKTDTIPPKTNLTNVSALVSNDFKNGLSLSPIYGLSVTHQVLGPLTAGMFFLSNGIVGVSIGINF